MQPLTIPFALLGVTVNNVFFLFHLPCRDFHRYFEKWELYSLLLQNTILNILKSKKRIAHITVYIERNISINFSLLWKCTSKKLFSGTFFRNRINRVRQPSKRHKYCMFDYVTIDIIISAFYVSSVEPWRYKKVVSYLIYSWLTICESLFKHKNVRQTLFVSTVIRTERLPFLWLRCFLLLTPSNCHLPNEWLPWSYP